MKYQIDSGVLEMDMKHTNGWTFKYFMQVNIAGEFVEKDFKPELVLSMSHLGQMGYTVTKPTPVMVKRWEWFEYEEFDGSFDKRALMEPYLAHNREQEAIEKAADTEAKKTAKAEREASVERDPALVAIIDEVIAQNPKVIQEFKSGKDKALNALVGQIIGATKKQQLTADAFTINKLLREQVDAS